jgi:thiol-disulfide isomerase/thioredoxin
MRLFITLLFISSFIFGHAQNTFSLKMNIEKSPATTVSMETFNKGWFAKRSFTLSDNFFETSVDLEQIEFFKISLSPSVFVAVIGVPGENAEISFNAEDIFSSMEVKGSSHTALIYKWEKQEYQLKTKIDSLISEYNSLSADKKNQETSAQYQSQIDEVNRKKISLLSEYITENINSPACLFLINKLDAVAYNSLYEKLALNLYDLYPKSIIVQNFYTEVESKKNSGIGAKAPDIRLPGVSGDTVSLYPLKGELIIIDFWASWCGPCRRENPHKVSVYNEYKDKGLAIYSVSLDNNEANWKNAINSDNLSWPDHVSELKGWQSVTSRLFGVSSIPANVILDADGKILAKNLRGQQLDDFISERLK